VVENGRLGVLSVLLCCCLQYACAGLVSYSNMKGRFTQTHYVTALRAMKHRKDMLDDYKGYMCCAIALLSTQQPRHTMLLPAAAAAVCCAG
jgi:hypothetical protein